MSRDAILARAITPNRQLFIMRNGGMYSSRIESVGEQQFTIAVPLSGSVPAGIRPGERLEAWIPVPTGLVRFLTPVIRRRVEGVPVLEVGWPATYERYQRREYVRVEGRAPIVLTFPGEGATPGRRYGAHTRNLSGGGASLQVSALDPRLVSIGQMVSVRLDVGDGEEPVQAEGRVVRKQRASGGQVSELGISFDAMSTRDRNRLCRHINDRQIELRKKGLL